MPGKRILRPQSEIRRFDVFAEWNRLKARKHHHLTEADARAYGLAVAKVVAGRKFHGSQAAQVTEWRRRARRDELTEAWWEHLGSGEEFRKKIIERMGKTFYKSVFRPAVRLAWDEGKTYEQIRDTLRQDWNVDTTRARTSKGR